MRRLMGISAPQQATESTEGGSDAAAAPALPPASKSTEGGSEARPMSMSDLIRARPRRHIDLFGQPPTEAASTPPQVTRTPSRRWT